MTQRSITLALGLLLSACALLHARTPKQIVYRPTDNTLVVPTTHGLVRLPLSGQHLFVADTDFKPQVIDTFKTTHNIHFIEDNFIYPRRAWLNNITNVSLLTAGTHVKLQTYHVLSRQPLTLKAESQWADVYLRFSVNGNSLFVNQTLVPKQDGCYSLSTPSLPIAKPQTGFKAVIPGYVHAEWVNPDFVSAYVYEHGMPNKPVVYQDKCATTPVSIMQTQGLTIGIAPEKQFPRKPYLNGENTHAQWNVGYGAMDAEGRLSPQLYYPVLGTPKAALKKGQKLHFAYRIILSKNNWYDVYKQVIYGMYSFDDMRKATNEQPLTIRINKIYHYMRTQSTKLFRKAECEGVPICAQDYRGGVHGANNDAMKNADYGAMWMTVRMANDTALANNLLPYVHNFKLKQQFATGKYAGAPQGQYFLWKSKRWVEEWGEHIEPIAITYYSLIDVANMLLFEPNDTALQASLRTSANLLLAMQRQDGSWPLGVSLKDETDILPDLKDLRPTFYGMYVAYKMLGDDKYLQAAMRGANWFIAHAVRPTALVGVCGDTRFAPDFATAMSVQALLDMHQLTGDVRYKDAALDMARYFTTYIYTHPADVTPLKDKEGHSLNPLQYTQAGLACEHIGVIGSANPQGPILLSSFAGMFVRLYQQTGDVLFLDMARAAANGRDRFVEPESGIAAYYWAHFNKVALPYPQHAWWQLGWLTDYLVAEAEMRSKGRISFPRGFVTPKVGPHKVLGFSAGTIDGENVELTIGNNSLSCHNAHLELLVARSTKGSHGYAIVMNSTNRPTQMRLTNASGQCLKAGLVPPFGIEIVKLKNI